MELNEYGEKVDEKKITALLMDQKCTDCQCFQDATNQLAVREGEFSCQAEAITALLHEYCDGRCA